jgi:hypothetical protein
MALVCPCDHPLTNGSKKTRLAGEHARIMACYTLSEEDEGEHDDDHITHFDRYGL